MLKANLRQAIHLTLAIAALASALPAAAQSAAPAAELENIVVTGSRLRRPEFEGPSPVIVLSSEQFEREGFVTVYEAVKSLTQINGATQDEQYVAGFTPNASAVSARGLGAGRMLVLLDGRRVTDYPLPYNGESNFVDIAAIPTAAVERIEFLSGGASAIYGSDAIAGVMNIILKKDLGNTFDVNVRYGDTTEGGGSSTRIQGVGGFNRGILNVTYAAEYMKRDPLYGYERSFMDSVQDNPVEALRINTRSILRSDALDDLDGDGFDYLDPGANACAPWPELQYSLRAGRGNYCGRPDADAQQTIRNERDRVSIYANATLDLDGFELFGSVNYFDQDAEYDSNFDYWFPIVSDVIYNTNAGPDSTGYEVLQRFILASEIGGREARVTTEEDRVLDYAVGFRGGLFGSRWEYEATYSHSDYKVENAARHLLNPEVEDYFLGPNLGFDIDPEGFGLPAYAVNLTRLYSPLTPQIYQQLSAVGRDEADSSNDVVNVVLTGDLFQTPSGPVSMAAIVEWGTQEYEITLDPRTIAGDFWAFTGSGGGGKRDRYAGGVEFGVPLYDKLRATLAGRYDKYDDITNVDDAFSYNLGLEFRPTDTLLLRGSLATSFRAPDMHFVFADPSGYFAQVDDEYWCRANEPGVSLPACSRNPANIEGESQGNPGLEEEEGESFTLGVVFQPTSRLSLALDYYHIEITGLVIDYPITKILEIEADCRLGQTASGAAVDVNSGQCQSILARVNRTPVDATDFSEYIDLVRTGPINTADYKTSGIDTSLSFVQQLPTQGSLTYQLNYSHVLKFDTRDFAGDPFENSRDDLQVFDFRSKMRGSVTWQYADWTTTLFGERLGSVPRWDETGRIGTHVEWSGSVSYRFLGGAAEASLFVDNLFDEEPPEDPSYDTYPYFSDLNYDPTGREWFVQLRYKFGE